MDRGARWAIVHGVTKSRTQLKQLSNSNKICTTALHNNFIKSVCPVYTKKSYQLFLQSKHRNTKIQRRTGFDVPLRILIKRKCQNCSKSHSNWKYHATKFTRLLTIKHQSSPIYPKSTEGRGRKPQYLMQPSYIAKNRHGSVVLSGS